MNAVVLVQPYMAINARTFIEPAFILRCINSNNDRILFSIMQVIADIIRYTYITTFVIAEIKTIYPKGGITEYSVELNLETLAGIGPVNHEMFSIPADACFGISATYWFIAVRLYIKIR